MCLTNQSNTSQDRNEEKKSCNGTFDICQPIALLSKKKKKKRVASWNKQKAFFRADKMCWKWQPD